MFGLEIRKILASGCIKRKSFKTDEESSEKLYIENLLNCVHLYDTSYIVAFHVQVSFMSALNN